MEPKHSIPYQVDSPPSWKILIQGHPGTGKTVAASTFPNPYWLMLETGLKQQEAIIKHVHGIDVSKFHVIPFHDTNFVRKFFEEEKLLKVEKKHPETGDLILNRRDGVKVWLNRYATDISVGSTLIVDSWTALQEYFDRMTEAEPVYTRDGKKDEYDFWGRKVEYSEEICSMLEQLNCMVVVLCHEAPERDKITGRILDKIQPLQQGKFVTKFKRYFSCCFRSTVESEVDEKDKVIIDPATHKPVNRYLWQTASNQYFDAKCPIVGLPFTVPAHYNSLLSK